MNVFTPVRRNAQQFGNNFLDFSMKPPEKNEQSVEQKA